MNTCVGCKYYGVCGEVLRGRPCGNYDNSGCCTVSDYLEQLENENVKVYVASVTTGELLAVYDGRNSIDPMWNNYWVDMVDACGDSVDLYV